MVWEKLIERRLFRHVLHDRADDREILGDADAWSVARGCAEEAVAVAKAADVRLDVGDPIAHIRELGGRFPMRGRRCCWTTLMPAAAAKWMPSIAAIPRLGKPLGVATPVNDTLVGIIRARERRCWQAESSKRSFGDNKVPRREPGRIMIACADRDEVYETFRLSAELLPRFSARSYSAT